MQAIGGWTSAICASLALFRIRSRTLDQLFTVAVGLALLVMPFGGGASAQVPATISSTYVRLFHSKLNGVDYKLTIVLPPDYQKTPTTRYPVLYLMDGNEWASLLGLMLPRLWVMGMLPKIIVVGVDYTGPSGRWQDYPLISQHQWHMAPNRGAANFMKVLRHEIIPFVDSAYRTDPTDRGIGGHSLGGFFTAYALLHDTDTFQRFWISSPSLFWDDEALFKDFVAFHNESLPKPIYVLTDVGGDELPAMLSMLKRFDDKLLAEPSNRIVLEALVQPHENHTTIVTSVYIRALEHLYMYTPAVIPASLDLTRFAGRYRLPNGTILTFVTDGKDLMYRDSTSEFPEGSLQRLSAYARNRFFARTPRIEIEFPEGKRVPSRLHFRDAMRGESANAVRLP